MADTDRYKVYERLGAGGVGAVFRAYDSQLKRWVAIKRLLSATEAKATDAETAELRREADALASLRNPNIVTIFDVASDADGLFIVMELLEGEDLADVLARGPLSYDDFKELASQSLEGLLAAHEKHILHRDIKPENIKIERLPGGRLQSKIIDFGLARAGLRARKQTEDQEGTVMGSIFYMAPEQLTREPVDARTDIYSLGCVFYEALSGRKAFDGENMAEVIDKHIEHLVTPLHEIAPYVPPWLGAWCMRLMACQPDDRPHDARQAIEEFRAWEKMPVVPMGPWMPMGYFPPPPASYPPQAYVPGQEYYQGPPHITSGQVPVYIPPPDVAAQQQYAEQPQYAEPEPEPVMVAEVIEEQPAIPVARHPSGPVRPPSARPGTKAPAKASAPAGGSRKKMMMIGGAAAAALAIALIAMSLGKKKGDIDSGGKASGPIIGASGPPAVSHQLPADRQYPLVDHAMCVHLVGNTGLLANRKGGDGKLANASPNEPVLEWHDLAPRANDNFVRAYNQSADYSPRRANWPQAQGQGTVKGDRSCLDFRLRNGTPSAMNLTDPEQFGEKMPFGSDTSWERGTLTPGATVIAVFQANSGDLPTRVCTLLGDSGASLSLRVDQNKNLVAEIVAGGKTVTITSKDVDATFPVIASVMWGANPAEAMLRARDARGKTFRGGSTPAAAAPSALRKLQLGRVQNADGSGVAKQDSFSGFLGEVLVYATALRPDQSDGVEGSLKSYYFQDPPKGAPAKK